MIERPNGDYHMPAEGDGAKKKGQNGGDVVPAIFPWDATKKAEGPGSRRKALTLAFGRLAALRAAGVQALALE